MSASVTLDSSSVVRALNSFVGGTLKEELKTAEKEISSRILREARLNHSYKSRTGKLSNATKVKGGLGEGGIILYVDERQAPYAKFIVKGTGEWASDPFIEEAIQNNEAWVRARLQKAIDSAVTKQNRKS